MTASVLSAAFFSIMVYILPTANGKQMVRAPLLSDMESDQDSDDDAGWGGPSDASDPSPSRHGDSSEATLIMGQV